MMRGNCGLFSSWRGGEGRGGGSAPCHRLRSHLSRMRPTPSVLSKSEMWSGPSSGGPDGGSEHKPPEASLQSAAPVLNIERWSSAGAGGGGPQPGV